jgi:S-adenosylmethionine:diacylglycerol 3-amino-3-carboxypropyl transferase
MTEELRTAIRAYWNARPNASNQEIATVFGVNVGRVSESLAGFRT